MFGIATLALVASNSYALSKWPPGPGGVCLDSVTIMQVQDTTAANTCHPATGDTVLGVAGIITGFDAIPTGFGFYIENSNGQPWSGIDVFTHGTNFKPLQNLAVGDSIVVEYAVTAEFQNGTEIFGPNNNFSSPNIILRKVSSGHALPPFFGATTTQMKETPTNTFAERYEGMLVQINETSLNSMKVARTVGLPFRSFLIVDTTAPSDSVLIDGGTLTAYSVPPLNSAVHMARGILDQRTRGFRIQLRDGNDIIDATPPGVADAYPVADTKVRVVFDRDVTPASATSVGLTGNYSLGSLGSVDAGVMDGTTAVLLTINNGLLHGDNESITVNGVVGAGNLLPMTTPVTLNFINGVLTVAEMSQPNPDSLAGTVCLDKSKFAGGGGQITQGIFGPRATLQGVVTGQYGNLFYMEDANPSPLGRHGGITTFAPPQVLSVGESYLLAGNVQEFFGETEWTGIAYVQDKGATPVPAPITLPVVIASKDTCDSAGLASSGNDAEDYESMLVKLAYVKVIRGFTTSVRPGNGFHVSELNPQFHRDTIFVDNVNNVLGASTAADSLNPNYPPFDMTCSITGVIHYTNSSFRVAPRNTADILRHGLNTGVPSGPTKLSFSVYPNPARRANIAFTLPLETQVDLGVFDVTGRRVATLVNGRLPAGEFSRAWSGRDASGKSVGAGVYFYRLRAGNDVRTVRAIMLGN
jgi:hypothetical protein